MNIKDTIAAIIQMQADGVIERYAIALQTGRAKDKTRLLQFIEADVLDLPRFQAIISRQGLQGAWQRFETLILGDNP